MALNRRIRLLNDAFRAAAEAAAAAAAAASAAAAPPAAATSGVWPFVDVFELSRDIGVGGSIGDGTHPAASLNFAVFERTLVSMGF